MGLSIQGYVVEPPRIGAANSPYTQTPNVVVLDRTAFEAHFPSNQETAPRVDYFVSVVPDDVSGDTRFLADARFGWTKNEGTTTKPFERFGYDGASQSFRLLPGAPVEVVGTLGPEANTVRLRVRAPVGDIASAPYRVSVAGTTFTAQLVTDFSPSGSGLPLPNHVEIHRTSGELNWNSVDLTSLEGEDVWFQRQQFYDWSEGVVGIGLVTDSALYLNPLPATGQYPMVRINQGLWLKPVEVSDDTGLAVEPPRGSVRWSVTTGRIKLNSEDVAAYPGAKVYYDGVWIAWDVSLPRQTIGTLNGPSPIVLPPEGGDLIFRVPGVVQFPVTTRVLAFTDSGETGTVEVRASDGAVRFSRFDRNLYGSYTAEFVSGDLPLEHGLAMRFYRSTVNPSALPDSPGDLTLTYTTKAALLAKPLLASPQIFLPSVPIVDPRYELRVQVEGGTGFYTGELPNANVPVPTAGLGYTMDFGSRQLRFVNRKNNVSVPLPVAVGATPLPDPLVVGENYSFDLEIAPNTNVYRPLTVGVDALLDPTPGVLTFTSTAGTLVGSGVTGQFNGTTFRDTSSTIVLDAGDVVVVRTGDAKGIYRVGAGSLASGVPVDINTGIFADRVIYEVRRNPEVIADRYWRRVSLADPHTWVDRIRFLGPGTLPNTLVAGNGKATFTDAFEAGADLEAQGIRAGDTLVILSGLDVNTAHTIVKVEGHTVQVTGSFTALEVTESYRIERSLRIPTLTDQTRIRIGRGTFLPVTLVDRDADFVVPATGTVMGSRETGNLRFNPADITGEPSVYWVHRLDPERDYRLQPMLAFVEFTERLLGGDEILVSYVPVDDFGEKQPRVVEHVPFLIRKEVTEPRTDVTNTVRFNPTGRTVSPSPAPAIFRGGRPQVIGTQCNVNVSESTITFLPDTGYMTDTFPHGDRVSPQERIYVDYYVYEAVGGEKNVTLGSKLYSARVVLAENATSFTVEGDRQELFPAGYLLKVDRTDVFRIKSVSYDSGTDITTVTLENGESFPKDFTNPVLYVPSGPTPTVPTPFAGSYFVLESAPYQVIPRGMNVFRLYGDRCASYQTGTIVCFTDATGSFVDLYVTVGCSLSGGWTEVILASNAKRQYVAGEAFIKITPRPILEDGAKQARLSRSAVLSRPYGVFRRLPGEAGRFLSSPGDYRVDDAGTFLYSEPLRPNEEIVIWYTGNRDTLPGVKLRASYTHGIAPDGLNGLLGQVLTMDYTVFSPDTFYFRVETLTNFKDEVAQYLRAQAMGLSASGGPRINNLASTPALYEQGRESVYFQEGHILNQDLVARLYLKYTHDSINHLEDALQSLDGRLVGADNGRFRFDGNRDNPVRADYITVTNEIDDVFRVSLYPYIFTFPPPQIQYIGTFLRLYEPGIHSRFFPERKSTLYNVTTGGQDTGATTGQPIMDFRAQQLTWVPSVVGRRLPRALVVQDVEAGSTDIPVDNATGSATFLRPAFATGMLLIVWGPDGSLLVSSASPMTALGTVTGNPEVLQVDTVPVKLPRGSTISLSTSKPFPDTTYQKSYRIGDDVTLDQDNGRLLFVKAYWPWDGSLSPIPIPNEFVIKEPSSQEYLEMSNVGIRNTLTAPYRFPALDGLAENDAHDTGLPMKTRTFDCERAYLTDELEAAGQQIANTTSAVPIPNVTVLPDGVTLSSPTSWPAPAIRKWDLVRFLTGPNATSGFHRIVAVTATTLQVDVPFGAVGLAPESVLVTASLDVTSGTCSFTAADRVQDLINLGAVQVGHTIIFNSPGHPNEGVRRQVIAKPTASVAVLDYPVAYPASSSSYRVSNHLSTYSALTGSRDALAKVIEVVLTNDRPPPPQVDAQAPALEKFFDGDPVQGTEGVLTDIMTPSEVSGTVMSNTLTALVGTDFVAAGVNSSHFVYVRAGANQGFYRVASVGTPTGNVLTVGTTFPIAGPVTCRVVKSYKVQAAGLQDIFKVLTDSEVWAAECQGWLVVLNQTLPVLIPPGVSSPTMYANKLLSSDLISHVTSVQARVGTLDNLLDGPIARITNTLGARDQFYNRRYTWIDGRVNLRTGFLARHGRAIKNRLETLAEQKNNLIRLLSLD